MNAAACAANPVTTDMNDQPPWSDDIANQGNPVLCEEAGPSQTPHQPKHQQLHITENFASDELCEASHNSSTHNTIAFSGGAKYNPTTSVTLPTSSGSVENLKVSTRQGCTPYSCHAVATVRFPIPRWRPSSREDQCVTPYFFGGGARVTDTIRA